MRVSSVKALGKLDSQIQKNETYLTPHIQINSKWTEEGLEAPQEIKNRNYDMIQQSHFWVYIQRK